MIPLHKKIIFVFGTLCFFGGLGAWGYHGIAQTNALIADAKAAGTDVKQWEIVFEDAQALPPMWPFSSIKKVFAGAEQSFGAAQALSTELPQLGESISAQRVDFILGHIETSIAGIKKTHAGLREIPDFVLTPRRQELKALIDQEMVNLLGFFEIFADIGDTLQTSFANEDRILILLQNTNEARPTGGFVGSVLILDFIDDEIAVRFEDIYALDRFVKPEDTLPAPEYFWPITQVISLRDANVHADFAKSADLYRHFFAAIDEKEPTIVATVSLDAIKELMTLVAAPLELEKWNMTLEAENADILLSLLVESKAAGRMEVKSPVMDFGKELFSVEYLKNISAQKILAYDWELFLQQKMFSAHSMRPETQALFEKWNLANRLSPKANVENFLSLDFLSVGANKSDRFVENQVRHVQEIANNGTVKNRVTLRRMHAGTLENLNALIEANPLPEDILERIDGVSTWKLGNGENRSMVRFYVPKESTNVTIETPSGEGYVERSEENPLAIVHVPANVLPGETIEVVIEYETTITRGSSAWRPYGVEYKNPAAQKVMISSVLVEMENGNVLEKSALFGVPHPMVDETLLTVIEFE